MENTIPHFNFDTYCLSCKLFETSKCTLNKLQDGLLNWQKLGCTIFISDQE